MARKTSKFLVGLFVIVGFAIVTIVVIWVGATKYFERGKFYISCFEESVQGLNRDSEVKFRGVTVGRVDTIRIAPDNRLIEVIMNINMKDDLSKKLVAQLQLTGITGIMFINLDRQSPGDLEASPKIDFASEYPVIPSKPSEIRRIIAGVEEIVEKLKQIDTKGISEEAKAMLVEVNKFFKSKKLKNIMANLESTSENLDGMTGQLDQMVAEGKIREMLVEARNALVNARDLFAGLQEKVNAMKLPQIGGKTRNILAEVETATEKLEETTDSLDELVERLKNRPSDLIFGKEPKPRWNEKR